MRLTVLSGNMFFAAVAGLGALGTTVGVFPFDCATAAGLQLQGQDGGDEERNEERGHSGLELQGGRGEREGRALIMIEGAGEKGEAGEETDELVQWWIEQTHCHG